jgi:hypothetical protein
MIDERYVELVHTEVDGELSHGQRAELERRLLADPEARRYRDEMRGVVDALSRIEEVEPPPDLRPSILGVVGVRDEMPGPGASVAIARMSPTARYAAAVAAGLILGVAGAQLASDRSATPDVAELVGTMAGRQGVPPTIVDRTELDLPGISGSVDMYEVGSTLVVEFDLASQQPIDVVVACDGRTARISGLGTRDQPGGHYAIALASPRDPGAVVDLQFFSGGVLIHRDTLRVSRSRGTGAG